eukprot:gene11040-biopygen9383
MRRRRRRRGKRENAVPQAPPGVGDNANYVCTPPISDMPLPTAQLRGTVKPLSGNMQKTALGEFILGQKVSPARRCPLQGRMAAAGGGGGRRRRQRRRAVMGGGWVGLTWLGLVWFGLDWFGLICF